MKLTLSKTVCGITSRGTIIPLLKYNNLDKTMHTSSFSCLKINFIFTPNQTNRDPQIPRHKLK